ncbi:MAG: hypothetical protein KDD56_04680 [Bdellovibrionales bacterium]|nr:hypothetical protein [Bdellovibrionales bacterium]
MQNKQHKIAIAALTATLGLGNFVLSKIKSDWNPEKGGVVKALAEFDNPKPLDSLTMPISDFIEEEQKTKPVDLNQKITLEDIRIGKVIINYDPEKQMYFSETVKEIQILLSQATGIQLQIDGIVGPLTTNGIGTNSIGAARWYACSRGLKDRSGAITAELLLALETNMPALPLLAIGEASLADIANERLSLSGTPIIISHKEHGQFFSKAYQEAQFFMQEAGIDLGHYGADGYFGQDGVTRLLPTYLRSRGINVASYALTPLIAKALIDQKPPLSVQEEIRNIISKKWFKELILK